VTFTASGVNGGTSPVVTWYKNNITQTTGTMYTYTPSNGDIVNAVLVAGGTLPACLSPLSATATGISLSVSGSISASVTIASSATTVCQGKIVSFTATGVGGGSAPTYTWYKNGAAQTSGNLFAYAPANGDQITAVFTAGGSGTSCIVGSPATSAVITIAVNASILGICLPPAISTITGPSMVNTNQQGVSYSVNTLSGVLYTWSVTGGASIVSGQGTNSITVNFGSSDGSVSLVATNANGSTSVVLPITVSSLTAIQKDELANKVSVFPNPFSVSLSIKSLDDFEYTIYNIEGLVLESGNQLSNNVGSNLATGVYILNIRRSSGSDFIKVVKE
jgi:hypothetical protein